MISIPLWQLVLFILGGVALGAVVAILALAKGKQHTGGHTLTSPTPAISPAADKIVTAPSAAAALVAAATRQERVKTFLKNRVANQRNVTIDETAKCLDVSSRRIRRLLDDSVLVAIPMAGGSRLVSAVSVLDLVVRREVSQAKSQPEVVAQEGSAGNLIEPPGVAAVENGVPKASPRQLYWYHVAGHDKPLGSIREALQVLGLNYAYTGWGDIPASIKAKIQRERVTADAGK